MYNGKLDETCLIVN